MRFLSLRASLFWLLFLLLLGGLAWHIYLRLEARQEQPKRGRGKAGPIAVEVAPLHYGPIALERTFSGTLEARAEFVAAPKVGGRIERLYVDLADSVMRNQMIATLDNAEYVQAVAQAEADLAVARANLAEARSLSRLAERELKRIETLIQRGVSAVSQRDSTQADQLAKAAHVQVTQAQVVHAEARLASARIRLGYSEVRAGWYGGAERRVVAERFVDEGETVAAQAPLLRIVELDPITAVFFVTEREYAGLQPGQTVTITTDAYPGEIFPGSIERIAPVFREQTRQARVEVRIVNPQQRLKPGMFVRAQVVLAEVANATLAPAEALTRREDRDGLFVLSTAATNVAWHPVEIGIRQGQWVQVSGEGLQGSVVVLGQQLLDDGAAVTLPQRQAPP